MSDRTTGGPAFPLQRVYGETEYSYGMTLRDWFAGQALRAIIDRTSVWGESPSRDQGITSDAAKRAYQFADAMIEARR